MSDNIENPRLDADEIQNGDAALAALFRKADKRPQPPEKHERDVRRAVYLEWHKAVKTRRSRRKILYSLAASVAVSAFVLGAVSNLWNGGGLAERSATVARISGTVSATPIDEDSQLSVATGLMVGQTLRTHTDSSVSLSWGNGGSLRLDQDTRVRVESQDEIRLLAGRVYFDSNPVMPSVQDGTADFVLSVRTDMGTVTPYGTQFQVSVSGDDLLVMVREGEVVVESDRTRATAGVNEQMLVSNTGIVTRSRIATFGNDWAWIERTAPEFRGDGQSILVFLQWVSRETGMRLVFDSDETEMLAASEKLVGYGSLDVTPSRALDVVMPATGLNWEVRQGAIYLEQ